MSSNYEFLGKTLQSRVTSIIQFLVCSMCVSVISFFVFVCDKVLFEIQIILNNNKRSSSVGYFNGFFKGNVMNCAYTCGNLVETWKVQAEV